MNSKDVSHAAEKLNPTIGNCNVFPATAASYSCALLCLNFGFSSEYQLRVCERCDAFRLKKDTSIPIVSMKVSSNSFNEIPISTSGLETHQRQKVFVYYNQHELTVSVTY